MIKEQEERRKIVLGGNSSGKGKDLNAESSKRKLNFTHHSDSTVTDEPSTSSQKEPSDNSADKLSTLTNETETETQSTVDNFACPKYDRIIQGENSDHIDNCKEKEQKYPAELFTNQELAQEFVCLICY